MSCFTVSSNSFFGFKCFPPQSTYTLSDTIHPLLPQLEISQVCRGMSNVQNYAVIFTELLTLKGICRLDIRGGN